MIKKLLFCYLCAGVVIFRSRGLFIVRNKASKQSLSSSARLFRVSNGEIPSEISSLDTASPPSLSGMILPDTSIVSLYGADNLGVILWTFVLYNGLYVTPLRPVDAFIPLVAQLVQQEGSQWYKDFQDGFSCQKPPLVDFITISFFILAGYLLNSFVNSSLGGDHSWGWSIAACLAIPSGLFSVAKSKKLTREDAIKQVREHVQIFLSRYTLPFLFV